MIRSSQENWSASSNNMPRLMPKKCFQTQNGRYVPDLHTVPYDRPTKWVASISKIANKPKEISRTRRWVGPFSHWKINGHRWLGRRLFSNSTLTAPGRPAWRARNRQKRNISQFSNSRRLSSEKFIVKGSTWQISPQNTWIVSLSWKLWTFHFSKGNFCFMKCERATEQT